MNTIVDKKQLFFIEPIKEPLSKIGFVLEKYEDWGYYSFLVNPEDKVDNKGGRMIYWLFCYFYHGMIESIMDYYKLFFFSYNFFF